VGDIESGGVASLTSPRISVISGGVACVLSAALFVRVFPALVAFDAVRENAVRAEALPELSAAL
jgi:hypothetical protein